MNTSSIGANKIGYNYPVFIIAEDSSNHNRDLRQAKKLIEVAPDAEANAVKFQTFSDERFYSKKRVLPIISKGKWSRNCT